MSVFCKKIIIFCCHEKKNTQHFKVCVMFSGICAGLPAAVVRRCHGDFLKEKGQISSLPKDATPKNLFFYTKTSSVFILIFIQKQRVGHNDVSSSWKKKKKKKHQGWNYSKTKKRDKSKKRRKTAHLRKSGQNKNKLKTNQNYHCWINN